MSLRLNGLTYVPLREPAGLVTPGIGSPDETYIQIDEEKKQVEEAPKVAPSRLLRAHPALGRGRSARPVKAWLSYYSATTGAVNTAFAGGVGIIPNQDSSWASWQGVFDEFRCLEATAFFNSYYTVDPTALPANSANMVVVYDPTTTVTLASVNAGLQFEEFKLQRIMIPTATGPKVSPMVETADGFSKLRIKTRRGTLNSNVTTTNTGGEWRPTGDATNYDWGNFAYFVSQGGATSAIRVEFFIRMLVEFRVRR